MYLKQFFVEGLGHASYLIASDSTGEAAIVDPRRDVDVYLEEAAARGLKVRYILETHNHNDFLSGARALVERTGATHVASVDAGLKSRYQAVSEGDELTLGELRVQVLGTPGHTPEHVTYVVIDSARAEEPVLAFTGGDLLVGTVGRPDLLGKELGEKLAPMLFDSLHQKILKLEDYVEVLPTHGSGSLCGRGIGSKRTTTIGYERRFNDALKFEDRAEFSRYVLSGNAGIPTYYKKMRPSNQDGVAAWRLAEPNPLSAQDVAHFVGHGAVVMDVRPNVAFGGGHIPGAVNVALGDSLATWTGWLLDSDTPLVLVLERDDQWSEVVTALARIGFEKVAGYLQGGISSWIGSALPIARVTQWSVQELQDYLTFGSIQLIDVRTDSEWNEGHIEEARHVRLENLTSSIKELDPDRATVVICGSGYRSSIAASLLQRNGFQRVVNTLGGMEAWNAANFKTVSVADISPLRPAAMASGTDGDGSGWKDKAAA